MKKSAIVIGAGIIGLATARALAVRNYEVTVIERDHRAVGASIRNFGMIWPVGQPDGHMYEQAMLSRDIWLETCRSSGIWFEQAGSIHVAHSTNEMNVLEELSEIYTHRNYQLLSVEQTSVKSSSVVSKGLMGSLYSNQEIIVNPRQVISSLPAWLHEKFGVQFVWGVAATRIEYPKVFAGSEIFSGDEIYICSGADFETLYPVVFAGQPFTRCKLQMMKIRSQEAGWRMGPALCGGLSLLHYGSFKAASSLEGVRRELEETHHDYITKGIHVMVSQNDIGELIVGDSHEYGMTPDPFNHDHINKMILDYLRGFASFRDQTVIETWNGIYPKLTNGKTNLVLSPEPGVTIINGLGGAGMTLGFGLCEQVVASATASAAANGAEFKA
jgi:FAD dependent oxidoreductase TIGR03364